MHTLLQEISSATADCKQLADLKPSDRALFVQLYHQLGEPFLLALDLLDHGRISRLTLDERPTSTFLCAGVKGGHVEIRLKAGHCTCPQFALERYKLVRGEQNTPTAHRQSGLGTLEMPTCKHLIACSLIESAGPVFEAKLLPAQDWHFA